MGAEDVADAAAASVADVDACVVDELDWVDCEASCNGGPSLDRVAAVGMERLPDWIERQPVGTSELQMRIARQKARSLPYC